MTRKFVECDVCASKPGTPTLCDSCYTNRGVIEELENAVKELQIQLAHENAEIIRISNAVTKLVSKDLNQRKVDLMTDIDKGFIDLDEVLYAKG